MEAEKSHKIEVSLEMIVYRADGSIREVRQICPEPSKPDMCEIAVRNADGSLVSRKTFPVRSFVQNYSEILYHATFGDTNNPTLTDTAGVQRTENIRHSIELDAAADDDDYGIWVGTGNTAVAVADYALDTKVDHGVGAGQLDYGQNLYVATTTDGTDIVYKVYRTFTNSSGNTITLQEVGIVADNYASHPCLILRDVTDENDAAINTAVADGQTATVTYTFTSTQASGITKQLFQLFESMHFDHSVNIKYVGGAGSTVAVTARTDYARWFRIQTAPANSWPVVVGTSSAALDSTGYELGAQINHGSGAGELSHANTTGEDVAVSGSDVTFVIKRVFTNLSGNSISIEEAGIHTLVTPSSARLMLVRTLTGTLAIEAGESVTAKFTFKHTV